MYWSAFLLPAGRKMLAKRLPQPLAAPRVLAAAALTSAPGVSGQRGAGQGAPTSTSQPLEPPAAPLVLLLAVPSCVLGLRERSAITLGTGSRRCPWRSAVRKRILPCFPLSSGSANSVFLFLAVLQRVMNVADLPSDKWHAISCLFRDHISSL